MFKVFFAKIHFHKQDISLFCIHSIKLKNNIYSVIFILYVKKYLRFPVFSFAWKPGPMALWVLKVANPWPRGPSVDPLPLVNSPLQGNVCSYYFHQFVELNYIISTPGNCLDPVGSSWRGLREI